MALAGFASAQLRIVVSIEPYREPVERLVGETATVDVLLPPGASPHAFDPTPRDVLRLAEADLVVVNGGLDAWLFGLNDALDEPRPLFVALDHVGGELLASDHEHGDEHADEHDRADADRADEDRREDGAAGRRLADVNPHVWLDPHRMESIVSALAERLSSLPGADPEAIAAVADAYLDELAALDAEIAALLAPHAGAPFVPFHDGWPYFAARYGLDLVAEIEPFPGREPSARDLAETIELLRATGARAVFTESQLDDRPARVLADEAGVALGVLDPIGGVAGRDGYIALLRYNAATVAEVLDGSDDAR